MSGSDGPPPEPLVLILTALPEESAPLLRRASRPRRISSLPFRAWEGTLRGRRVVISETGAGAQAAAGAAGSLFARFAPTLWIGAGLAGALSPELPFGAIVVSGEIVDERGSPVARPDEEMARRALACDPAARLGRVVCADGIVYSAAQKQRLRESAAGPFPAAVDLESSAWARAGAGVRGLVVRAISDAADDEIPAFVAAAVTSGGEIERKRLVRYALLHPRSIGKLLELRRRARFCGDRLADFLERFAGNGF